MGSYPPSRAYKGWAMYTVYKHTTPSGKVYIGITGRAVEKRFASKLAKSTSQSPKLVDSLVFHSKLFPTCAVGSQKHLVDTIGNMLKSRGDYD